MRLRRSLDLVSLLGTKLLAIAKPSRYLGGELGSLPGLEPRALQEQFLVALSFPDLYEIGMSNNAVRLLYDGLNRVEGLRCERVFAPAPDFEKLLREEGLPLPTLETGIPLADADLVGFSVGYELAATSILTILESGQVPIRAAERDERHPIVIAGGPAVSNPHYLAAFLDAVFIGEAEDAFFELCAELVRLKKEGASRSALLACLAASRHVWVPGKKAARAIYSGFPTSPYAMTFPVPVLKTVQSHGTAEIMRGCPHGCRFCHAGFYYRPQRMKNASKIREEVRALIEGGGYREVTLASLSSGDYSGIVPLISSLNAEWGSKGVSFQLPSLKVNTFTLPLIETLSEVRKSGLTFAVESPEDYRQLVINKDVNFDKIVSILGEARSRGFRMAKFYFMIGLPVPGRGRGEAEAIISFFSDLTKILPLSYNVNVGIFVPKPHTPFQWCAQLDEEEAMAAIHLLKDGLRRFRSVKLSWHSPFVAQLESIFARGDERVGELIIEAWKRGARLDAWEEHFDRDLWRQVISEASWDPIAESTRWRDTEEKLPWEDVSIRVSKAVLKREWERSQRGELTSACEDNCTMPCGSCSDDEGVVYNYEQPEAIPPPPSTRSASAGLLLFRYEKQGLAAFYPHLGIVEALERALSIAGVPVSMSEGFNPAPRLEISQPLPLGVSSRYEVAQAVLCLDPEVWVGAGGLDSLRSIINAALPRGLSIASLETTGLGLPQKKRQSLGSLTWGSSFRISLRPAAGRLAGFGASLSGLAASIGGASLEADEDGSWLLTIPNPARKEEGLMGLLARASGLEHPLEALVIERFATLSPGAAGPVPILESLLEA